MKQYLSEVILYQRTSNDYTAEKRIIEVKSMKIISRKLFDVLVYDKDNKGFYYYIPMERCT